MLSSNCLTAVSLTEVITVHMSLFLFQALNVTSLVFCSFRLSHATNYVLLQLDLELAVEAVKNIGEVIDTLLKKTY